MFTRALVALSLVAPCFIACSDPSNSAADAPDGGAQGGGAGAGNEPEAPSEGGAPHDEKPDQNGSAGAPEPEPGNTERTAFFLPTDEPTNTAAPRVETDARGGTHFLYPAFAGGAAFYAYCDSGCAGPDDFSVVRLPTQGSVTNAALALDDARPRALLATFTSVYYASCDAQCTEPKSWTTTKIMDHGSDYEVSGEALALQDGKPRFILHAYRKFLGAFQKPETFYVACDADCHDADAWTKSYISDQLWEGSSLRFDAAGTAHVATAVQVLSEQGPMTKVAGYFECAADCDVRESWKGLGIDYAYENNTAYPRIEPSVALALTAKGAPRVVVLGKDDDGTRISYHACDDNCLDYAGWAPYLRITDAVGFGAGLDLALSEAGSPRIVFTSGFDIVMAECSDEPCTDDDAEWSFSSVERASSMKPDEIILWPNCTVASWMLHGPSLALSPAGKPRVGYQARDVSGGVSTPDPTKPPCTAGTDMSLTRALLQ